MWAWHRDSEDILRLDTTYLRSRLARRIFWLFVVCALVPISALAVVSLLNVSAELQRESRRRLIQSSHDEGMAMYERLVLLDANLRLIADVWREGSSESATATQAELSPNLKGRYRGVAVFHSDGTTQVLNGLAPLRFDLAPAERKHLDSGKTLLSVHPCEDSRRCIYLTRELRGGHSQRDQLVAEIEPAFLWDAENLPELVDICVLDRSGQLVYCSRKAPDGAFHYILRPSSGEFEWTQGGQTYLAHYWKMPMKAGFLEDHWTVVASEAKYDALSSLSSFRRSFVLVILLALWITLLLSLIQIRRTLVPLEKLQEGTRRVAGGEFGARVAVQSKDEFQELATSFNFMAARIETQVRSLKTRNEIDGAILSSWNLDQIADVLIARLPEILPYEAVGITILYPDAKQHASTYFGTSDGGEGLRVSNTDTCIEDRQFLARHSESQVLENCEKYPQYLSPLLAQGMRHFLVVPILLEGKPAAVLTLGHAAHHEWTLEEKQQARQVADQVAVALSNAGLVSQLKQLHWGTLTALAKAIDAKSPWTAGHSERVTNMAIKIGRELGLSGKEIDILHAGGLLHDIGKIGIPGALLDKPGQLTEEERRQIQEHVLIGVRILKPIAGFAEFLPIVQEHHEWFNGKGYPYGIAAEQITLHGRIFAVADVYDALITDRPYRKGMPLERVMAIIRGGAGTQFDPQAADAFSRVLAREQAARESEPVSKSVPTQEVTVSTVVSSAEGVR
jgi:putative nucleotidyltransferase with HDIG domain